VVSAAGPGLFGPDSTEVFPRRLRAGDTWCESLAVIGYPREVGLGWLSPLLGHQGAVDVSVHLDPVPMQDAALHLRRQLARLESTRRIDARHDRLVDPALDAAADDASELAAHIARGEGRLFRVGLYITVRAHSEDALAHEVQRVRSLCASMLLDARPVTFRAPQGWASTLPLGTDALKLRRTFDTRALAASFPFASAEINASSGILAGRNAMTGGLVFVDRFSLDNYNQVILARSGAGKSYLAKLQILRSLYAGIDVMVVDPEDEYLRLARAVGGTEVRLGAPGVLLNPLDLAHAGQPEALTEQALFMHSLVAVMVGSLVASDRAVLDKALLRTYEAAGITAEPSTHQRPAPLLRDLVAHLQHTPDGARIADQLEPFANGSYRGLFAGPTTIRPEGHLVVYSLRSVPEELKPTATMLALESVWRRVARGERRRRIVVVDEAWLLMGAGGGAGARFLQRLAKSGRKCWCGLTTITQDVADLLGSDLGQAVVTNASTQVLLGQSPQAIEALGRAFNLSDGERSFLLSCDRGEGILVLGSERAAIKVIASQREDELATSAPEDLEALEALR